MIMIKEILLLLEIEKGEIGMPGPLLLSVIILSSLMIGITQFFHHTDTTEEVKDKVRLVFPIFIISISFCILLNKDGYIVAVFSFFVAIVLITVLYYVMKDFIQK
ncbi:hypothetical protein BACERE00185_05680 [Bacillus mobilis]|uniref:Group-specific protein n=7 Tax=Bacillus cereus group TaxID=86661 RepID=A0A1Y6AVR8_9BACI|nr:hypothetical protein BACERE00185_05680 [Bacillus mobilis]